MAAHRLSRSWPLDISTTHGDIDDAKPFTLHTPAAIVVPQAYYMQVHAAVANTVYDVTIRKRDLYWTIHEHPIPHIYVALHVNITGAATHPVHEPHVTLVYNAPLATHPGHRAGTHGTGHPAIRATSYDVNDRPGPGARINTVTTGTL